MNDPSNISPSNDTQAEAQQVLGTVQAPLSPQDIASLPPIEPPSAGFIARLFLVPALIVTVVIGVYMLFGKLASQDADWRQVVTDIKSPNPHVRWTNALTLAQLLDADNARGKEGQQLASNTEIADTLSELYLESIKPANPTKDQVSQTEFLAMALGRMDVPERVYPSLLQGVTADRAENVRQHSLMGIAMATGRAFEAQRPLERVEVQERILEVSQDPTPVIRQLSAYVLGLLPSDKSSARLSVMLTDVDQMTRVNAAIAISRSHSTMGLDVFSEILTAAKTWSWEIPSPAMTQVNNSSQEPNVEERATMLRNVLSAVGNLNIDWTQAERDQLKTLLEPLTETPIVSLRIAADKTIRQLDE